jgi:hypothetical protein
MNKLSTFTLLALILCLFTGLAAGQSLMAPPIIQADADGSFEYVAMYQYPASGAYFGGFSIYATENIAGGGTFIDGFCMSWVSGNTQGTFTVTGDLDDPTLSGIVDFEWFICDPFYGQTVRTMVLPPTVSEEVPTWSRIKQMYR